EGGNRAAGAKQGFAPGAAVVVSAPVEPFDCRGPGGRGMQNKVVVRYQDGRVLKGFTSDFIANKEVFHVTDDTSSGNRPVEIFVPDLKAIFFVKDHVGDNRYTEHKQFDPARPVAGRKIRVDFKDGEHLVGITQAYQPGRPGFFMVPVDPRSNNDRIYVVSAATRSVKYL
ncbi:MAG TPA: hypothetical protein VIU29_02775, partial [Candidatus Deferrimicrobiaceae bacterium]